MSEVVKDQIKNRRIQFYFDLICGSFNAIAALTGIGFFAANFEVSNYIGFVVGLTFWILYLTICFSLICYGLYTKRKETLGWVANRETESRKIVKSEKKEVSSSDESLEEVERLLRSKAPFSLPQK